MLVAVCVLSAFAAAWGEFAAPRLGAPLPLRLAPLLISAVLIALAFAVRGRFPNSPERRRRAGRLVAIWSSVEGVAILVAVNLLGPKGAELVSAAVALIVGLHFLPLARGLPQPSYYASGAALVLIGVAGFLVPALVGPVAVSLAAALTLWLTAGHLVWTVRTPVAARVA